MIQVVAIDGGAGSGKSTLSKSLANELGWAYFDTGAMYRSVALACMWQDVDTTKEDLVLKIVGDSDVIVSSAADPNALTKVTLNGNDVSSDIRSSEVGQEVAKVAVHPKVRERLVEQQQSWIKQHGNSVVEGRDISAVVWPDAVLKIFLKADLEERARRRSLEFEATGDDSSTPVNEQLAARDASDSTKGGLVQVGDAIEIDTTNHTPEETLRYVLDLLRGLPEHA